MISKIVGTLLKKDTKTKMWWMKLAACLVLSNIFFFIFFSGPEEAPVSSPGTPAGWVEVQLEAKVLTSFDEGKRVLLIHRRAGRQLPALFKAPINNEGRLTLLVEENLAPLLFQLEGWEVLPFMKNIFLKTASQGHQHEIRY